MKSINDIIKTTNKCEHAIKLLEDIISSIKAYPELNETLSFSQVLDKNLNEYSEKITKKYNEEQIKITKSNILELENTLIKLKRTQKKYLDRKVNKNIEERIKYLNLEGIRKIYIQEGKRTKEQILKLKIKIEYLLKKADKSLTLYAKLEQKNNKYILIETLENKITLKEVFEKIPIENIVKDLELEDYEQDFYHQLETDPLDLTYKELYISTDDKNIELNKLKNIYPNIIIAEKLAEINQESESKILKECIDLAKLILKTYQLENLKKYLEDKEYYYTINHINEIINNIQTEILNIENILNKKFFQEFSKLNIKESLKRQNKPIQELVQLVLEITENKAKAQVNYDYNNIYYREIIKEDMLNYQQFLLKDIYNITISIEELQELLNPISNIEQEPSLTDRFLLKKIKKQLSKLL